MDCESGSRYELCNSLIESKDESISLGTLVPMLAENQRRMKGKGRKVHVSEGVSYGPGTFKSEQLSMRF